MVDLAYVTILASTNEVEDEARQTRYLQLEYNKQEKQMVLTLSIGDEGEKFISYFFDLSLFLLAVDEAIIKDELGSV